MDIERLLLVVPRGFLSRLRLIVYRLLGMKQGRRNRIEGEADAVDHRKLKLVAPMRSPKDVGCGQRTQIFKGYASRLATTTTSIGT